MADFSPGPGSDQVESLMIEVRASTQDFSRAIKDMGSTIDSTLIEGFSRAGNVLERGLLGAIRRGSLGFDDLKRIALNTINEIAAQAVGTLFDSIGGNGGGLGGGKNGGGLLGGLGAVVGSILGLPGRATGGIVAPGRGYLVGERGPELFVPASAGRIDSNPAAGGSREVRVSINVVTPQGASAPQALQRSTRQVASAVRRALSSS